MSVKSDKWIIEMSRKHKMLEPFAEAQVRKGVISYGVSSYGYDMRVDNEFKIYKGPKDHIIDPKNFNDEVFETIKADHCIIPPNSFVLAKSVEYFRIPRKVVTICFGKSTYARCGIIVNVTPSINPRSVVIFKSSNVICSEFIKSLILRAFLHLSFKNICILYC